LRSSSLNTRGNLLGIEEFGLSLSLSLTFVSYICYPKLFFKQRQQLS
jgi:hypothetical protein